jgi:hypothetical protein
MYIAVDFDGTCVTHEYPRIGKDIGAVPVLKKLSDSGHKIILNTMRSGKELADAIKWFIDNDIPLFGANENPTQKSWTDSPKVHANVYIDDCGIGCPVIYNPAVSGRPYVDWTAIEKILKKEIR